MNRSEKRESVPLPAADAPGKASDNAGRAQHYATETLQCRSTLAPDHVRVRLSWRHTQPAILEEWVGSGHKRQLTDIAQSR